MRLPFFLMLFVFNCSPKSQRALLKTDDLLLIEATFNRWVAGHAGGGKGIDYYFTIIPLSESTLAFDSLFVGEVGYPIFVSKRSSTISAKTIVINKGDTLIVRAEAPANSLADGVTSIRSARIMYRKEKQVNYVEVPEVKESTSPNRQ